MENSIEAQVIDDRHLMLIRPTEIPPGSKVMVTIERINRVSEDQSWYLLSSMGLQAAYGEDEPDYSVVRITRPNPEYQP